MNSRDAEKLRKRCYLDVLRGEENMGRIVIELFDDIVPRTAENFRGICTAEYGVGQSTKKKLSYVGVLFHRIIPGFMIQAGDFSAFDGTGGESIYGGKFKDENFQVKHDRPYLVSMANAGQDLNGSQFFITCVPCPTLDGKHVVFGQVIAGMDVVQRIEQTQADGHDRPLIPVKISKSGELIPVFPSSKSSSRKKKKKKPAKSESGSSDSDSDLAKRHAKKKAAKADKKRLQEEALKALEPQAYCTVRADEIPDIPENRFLQRQTEPRSVVLSVAADSTNSQLDHGNAAAHASGRLEVITHASHTLTHLPRTGRRDCEGITIKGRGAVRYSRRSVTPPYWHSRSAMSGMGIGPRNVDQSRRINGSAEGGRQNTLESCTLERTGSMEKRRDRSNHQHPRSLIQKTGHPDRSRIPRHNSPEMSRSPHRVQSSDMSSSYKSVGSRVDFDRGAYTSNTKRRDRSTSRTHHRSLGRDNRDRSKARDSGSVSPRNKEAKVDSHVFRSDRHGQSGSRERIKSRNRSRGNASVSPRVRKVSQRLY